MLVITRREGETIHVGNDIVITLTQVRGSKARVGIEAPPEVIISRGELGKPGEHRPATPAEKAPDRNLVPV